MRRRFNLNSPCLIKPSAAPKLKRLFISGLLVASSLSLLPNPSYGLSCSALFSTSGNRLSVAMGELGLATQELSGLRELARYTPSDTQRDQRIRVLHERVIVLKREIKRLEKESPVELVLLSEESGLRVPVHVEAALGEAYRSCEARLREIKPEVEMIREERGTHDPSNSAILREYEQLSRLTQKMKGTYAPKAQQGTRVAKFAWANPAELGELYTFKPPSEPISRWLVPLDTKRKIVYLLLPQEGYKSIKTMIVTPDSDSIKMRVTKKEAKIIAKALLDASATASPEGSPSPAQPEFQRIDAALRIGTRQTNRFSLETDFFSINLTDTGHLTRPLPLRNEGWFQLTLSVKGSKSQTPREGIELLLSNLIAEGLIADL